MEYATTPYVDRFGQLSLLPAPTAEEYREAKSRRGQRRRAVKTLFVGTLPEQFSIDFASLVQGLDVPSLAEALEEAIDDADPWEGLWDVVDELDVHLWFLRRNLRYFEDCRTGKKTRNEVLNWILERFAKAREKPRAFSFQACCLAGGVDPYEMQELVIRQYAPNLVPLLANYSVQ